MSKNKSKFQASKIGFFQKKLYFCPTIHQNISAMKAFVNDIEVRTYYGAKVKSVVLAYCRAHKLPLNLENIEIRDAFGNTVGLDGSLRANSKIYVKF